MYPFSMRIQIGAVTSLAQHEISKYFYYNQFVNILHKQQQIKKTFLQLLIGFTSFNILKSNIHLCETGF